MMETTLVATADSLEAEQLSLFGPKAAQHALDELVEYAGQYKSSKAFYELVKFVACFRFYSPFNAMLVYLQQPGATYVAPASRWLTKYGRRIKPGTRPLVILKPMGPVMFVFDVSDTDPEPNAPPLPPEIEKPFEVQGRLIGSELERTIENVKRDGVRVSLRDAGSQSAGVIGYIESTEKLEFLAKASPKIEYVQVPLRYEIFLNRKHSTEEQYATLVHELAHLYCGHLGTPNKKWWPDRQGLSVESGEFEAETVSYWVCARLGLKTKSDQYIANYVQNNQPLPAVSLGQIEKATGWIEVMGQKHLEPRKK